MTWHSGPHGNAMRAHARACAAELTRDRVKLTTSWFRLLTHLATRGRIESFRSSSDGKNQQKAWLRRAIVGGHVDASGAFDLNRTGKKAGECGPASWDPGPCYGHDLGRPSNPHRIEQSALFVRKVLINIDVFSSSTLLLIKS